MFINYQKCIDYKLILKLCYDRVITIPNNFFKEFYLIEIKSLLINGILQFLQYDSNKYAKFACLNLVLYVK